jgi:hypothetical protein
MDPPTPGPVLDKRKPRPSASGAAASVGRLANRVSGWWTLVAVLTIAALLLRLPAVGQGLALDEMLTFEEIHGHSLGDLIDQMRLHGEDNPPLYYILAWIGAQTGDDTDAIRLPSLILGTATVPLVFLLGARTVGRGPGALAAAFAAVSPFALFYGAEARAYATAIFFSALATLVFLRALEDESRRWWWAGYVVCATALVYTHYTGGFVLAAQAAWALVVHRSRWRAIALASAVPAIAFLPWAATWEGGNFRIVVGGPLRPTLSSGEALLAFFPGQPFSQILRPRLDQFPGVVALALVGAGVVAAVVGALATRPGRRRDTTRPPPPRPLALLVALALASPLGVFLYAVVAHDIFLSRYFNPSLPGLLVLVGWLLLRPRGPLRLLAVGLATAGMLIGTEKMFDDRFRRPPLDEMASFIRAETGPGDTVVENFLPKLAFYTRPLHAYLGGERSFSFDGRAESEVWRRRRVAIVAPDLSILPFTPARWGPGLCFRRVAHRAFPGAVYQGVAIYVLGPAGRECLRVVPTFAWGFGAHEEDLAHQWRWLVAPSGRLVLRNPTRRPRTVRLTMSFDRTGAPPARVLVRYPDGAGAEITAAERPTAVRRVLRLAPGRNPLTLTTRAEPIAAPQDPRTLYLRVVDLRVDPR